MKKNRKRFFVLSLSIVLSVLVLQFHYRLSEGFRIQKAFFYPSSFEDDSTALDALQDFTYCFEKPFKYIGRGGQVYVFESFDKKYVLKIVRFHKANIPLTARLFKNIFFCSKHYSEIEQDRLKRFNRAFESYQIAWNHLRKETGMVYMKLFRAKQDYPQVVLSVNSLIKHQLDLKDVAFIIQKRTDDFRSSLERMLQNNEDEELKKCISSYVEMAVKRSMQMILNKDYLLKNFGYVQTTPIEIDLGNFYYDYALKDPKVFQKQLHSFLVPLIRFLEKRDFEMAVFAKNEIDRQMNRVEK